MEHAQREEFLHFAMDLEFLARRKEKWRLALQKILFKEGDIVELAEQAEDAVEDWSAVSSARGPIRPLPSAGSWSTYPARCTGASRGCPRRR